MKALSARAIYQRLRDLGLSPRKALGQHFLRDARALGAVVEAADLSPSDVVVEVGPGLGVLTEALARRAGRVMALELDEALARSLRGALGGLANVQVLQADARQVDPCALVGGHIPYKMVGNLPYYAALPILRRFLESPCPPTLVVVMVQREVAQQMVASPGRMSLLSVAVQFYGRPRIVATVPPRSFYPPPQVTSAIVRMEVGRDPSLEGVEVERFFALVRDGFRAPRKQLARVLADRWGRPREEVEVLLRRAGVDPTWRAEDLSLAHWRALYEVWNGQALAPSAGPGQD